MEWKDRRGAKTWRVKVTLRCSGWLVAFCNGGRYWRWQASASAAAWQSSSGATGSGW